MNKITRISIITSFIGLVMISGCKNMIYDDINGCSQNIHIHFYSKTPCQNDSTYIGNTSSVSLFVLDKDDKVIDILRRDNVNITKDYQMDITLLDGYYRFIAWTGVNEEFIKKEVVLNRTTSKELFFKLHTIQQHPSNLNNLKLYQGISDLALYIPKYSETRTIDHETYINLIDKTYQIDVVIDVDSEIADQLSPKDVGITISSQNGEYNLNGTMPLNTEDIIYEPHSVQVKDTTLTASYRLLDLKSGHHNNISIYNKKDGNVIYKGDLVGNILLDADNINLGCEHRLTVKFLIQDKCKECATYETACIWVNNWRIHSYKTILFND